MGARRIRGPMVIDNNTVFTAAGNYTLVNEVDAVINKTVAATSTVTLPASPLTGRRISVKDGKGDAATYNVTVQASSGNIDGSASYVISENYGGATFEYNGTQWNVVSSYGALSSTELGFLNSVAAGTAAASKAVVADANVRVFSLVGLTMGGTAQQTISNGDGTTALVPEVEVLGTTKATGSMLLASFSATATSAAAPAMAFLKSANATIGSNTVVVSGEVLGEIVWYGADGTDFKSAAGRIQCIVDTTPGTGDMPGRLVFSTSIDAGETLTEAMRIDNAQRRIGGAVAAQTVGGVVGSVQDWGLTAATSFNVLGCASTTDATRAELAFIKGGNAAVGSFTTVASGEALGAITWYGDNGTTYANAFAQIAAFVDATPGTSDAPGQLRFLTTPDGSTTLTEAMRINSAQTVTCSGGFIARSTQAAAITTTRVLTAADSGGIFSVAKTTSYAITLPTPAQGIRFKFLILDTGANAVTFSDGSAHLFGNICEAGTTPIAMTGTTLSAASGGSVGDWLEFEGIDATHYLVTGSSIQASKFTIA